MARQIMAISEKHHLIWEEIAADKWQETLMSRFDSEDGDYEWNVISTAKYLEEADVSDFAGHGEPARHTKNYEANRWENIIVGHDLLDKAFSLVAAR